MAFLQNFQNDIGGVNFNFESVPDLQPKALRGIIRGQKLPEENVLRNVITTVPVSDKLFKAMVDDAIDLAMTPEVDMNADDPMIGDSYQWTQDAVHEYRQAAQINIELGQQLLAPEGSPQRYAGMALLQRYMRNITNSIDNRREYNRAMAMLNAHSYNKSRFADLSQSNVIDIVSADDKWDNPAVYEGTDRRKVNPFNQLSAAKERFAFLAGVYPNMITVPSDVYSAMETHNNWSAERTDPVMAGARARVRDMDIFVSLGRQNVGDAKKAKLVPTIKNTVVMAYVSPDTISEKQYDINRLEQFTTANRLFYYVRFWHKSKVTVERSICFFYIKNVLANPFEFDSVNSLIKM